MRNEEPKPKKIFVLIFFFLISVFFRTHLTAQIRNKPMRNIHVSASTTRAGIYCFYNCALKIEKEKPKPLVLTKVLSERKVVGAVGTRRSYLI
jgi:hypothetical protein